MPREPSASRPPAGAATLRPGVFAVVVWFHPGADDARNLLSYEPFVEGVVVVDNSPTPNGHLLPDTGRIRYLFDGENKGLGKALNIGCRCAIGAGAAWLLTMDQDSAFAEADLLRLLARTQDAGADVAALGAKWRDAPEWEPGAAAEVDYLITSGSLVRAAAFLAMGGYNEDLFIDEVDHEFSFRLRRAGYRLLRVKEAVLQHQLGEPLTRRVLGREVYSSNHGPVRRYYMTRNRLYMRRHFPEARYPYLRRIASDAVRVLLVEERKAEKLLYMVRGAVDSFRGIQGPLPSKTPPR